MTHDDWNTSEDPAAMLCAWCEDGLTAPDGLLRTAPSATPRKLRLYAVACCRQVWHLLTDAVVCARCRTCRQNLPPDPGCSDCRGTGRVNRSRHAVEVAEQFADGLATDAERLAAENALDRPDILAGYAVWPSASYGAGRIAGLADPPQRALQAALLRDIVGDPWAPVTLCPKCPPGDLSQCPKRKQLLTPTVLALAAAAYDDRGEDGALCPDRLAVLADALEDASCTEQTLLRHLRGEELVHWDSRKPVPSVYNHWRPLRGPHVRGCWAVDLLLGKE